MAHRSRSRTQRGAAAVEFALVMIPVIMLLFGLVQYGLYFWAMQGGSDIARSAARLAAVGTPATCTDFRSTVTGQVNSLSSSGGNVTVTRTYTRQTPDKVSVGDQVLVSVRFRSIDLNFPFVPFVGDGMVTSEAQARVDYVPSQPESCS